MMSIHCLPEPACSSRSVQAPQRHERVLQGAEYRGGRLCGAQRGRHWGCHAGQAGVCVVRLRAARCALYDQAMLGAATTQLHVSLPRSSVHLFPMLWSMSPHLAWRCRGKQVHACSSAVHGGAEASRCMHAPQP